VLADVTVLVNPNAGRGRSRRVAGRAVTELRRLGVGVDVVVTRSAAHALDVASGAVMDGRDAILVCGGDGAVASVLPALARGAVPLGVLPGGSGNDFARALGLPLRDPVAVTRRLALGAVGRVDLGSVGSVGSVGSSGAGGAVGGRWFGTVVAAGFDARVNERMNRMTWPRGRFRYHAALVGELAGFRPLSFVIETEDQRLELEAMLVAVGNTPSYGGGMRICPAARIEDGMFDVTVVRRISRAKLIQLFPSVYPGTHVRRAEVLTLRGRSVSVAAAGVVAYADGERVAPLPVVCKVESKVLPVLGIPDRA
jgi:diacylglycerol kinase (ATP)